MFLINLLLARNRFIHVFFHKEWGGGILYEGKNMESWPTLSLEDDEKMSAI